MRRAFTLIELLVVIAIIAILAAILFPVFAQAKAAAKKTAAISNSKQTNLAFLQYMSESDDRFPPVTYNNTYDANPANPDAIPQTLIFPYMKNLDVLKDPLDDVGDDARATVEQVINPNSVPYKKEQRLFNIAYKSDFGINWQFTSNLWITSGVLRCHTISSTQVANPSAMIYTIDSVWNRTSTGVPYGGGNVGVDPPCIFDADGKDTRPGYSQLDNYYWYEGWNPTQPNAWNVFGGVWPWHGSKGQVVTNFADGHTKSVAIGRLGAGCNVQDRWGGRITDPAVYMWNPQ